MNCKTDQIRTAWAAGDRIGALRIAARFFDRSTDTKIFKRGMNAYNNPEFYRQLGKDPELLMAAALELLAKRFGLSTIKADASRSQNGSSRPCRDLSLSSVQAALLNHETALTALSCPTTATTSHASLT